MSAAEGKLAGRELQPFEFDASAIAADLGEERGSGLGEWDQFEANRRLFGDEAGGAATEGKDVAAMDVYTTQVDVTKFSREQIKAAEKLAREIEGEKSKRNGKTEEEEDLHSAVRRTDAAVEAAAGDSFTDAGVLKRAVERTR